MNNRLTVISAQELMAGISTCKHCGTKIDINSTTDGHAQTGKYTYCDEMCFYQSGMERLDRVTENLKEMRKMLNEILRDE